MNTYSIPGIPSPLKEVLEFEGVYNRNIYVKPDQKVGVREKILPATRWGVFGLPGLGKSTICKKVYFDLFQKTPIIYFPEAADYAVKVLGLPIIDFEPFLNKVYDQMEVLASILVKGIPGLVILKEPSCLQNDIYLLIQKSYTSSEKYRMLLDRLAEGVKQNQWELETVSSLHDLFAKDTAPYNIKSNGRWTRDFVRLTSNNPLKDLSMSWERQNNSDRDPRLTTSNVALLCGYLAGINYIVSKIEQTGKKVMNLNPMLTVDDLSLEMEKIILYND